MKRKQRWKMKIIIWHYCFSVHSSVKICKSISANHSKFQLSFLSMHRNFPLLLTPYLSLSSSSRFACWIVLMISGVWNELRRKEWVKWAEMRWDGWNWQHSPLRKRREQTNERKERTERWGKLGYACYAVKNDTQVNRIVVWCLSAQWWAWAVEIVLFWLFFFSQKRLAKNCPTNTKSSGKK